MYRYFLDNTSNDYQERVLHLAGLSQKWNIWNVVYCGRSYAFKNSSISQIPLELFPIGILL